MNQHEGNIQSLSRRQFLQYTGIGTVGLLLATQSGCSDAQPQAFVPNLFIAVDPSNKITMVVARPEIGQGVRTALPMILTEEMDADWRDVVVQTAPISAAQYGQQTAVSSRSIFLSWVPLRRAGAAARHMLVQAAAQEWGVAANRCVTQNGKVVHSDSNRQASYGELAARANRQAVPMPQLLPLKKPSQYRLLGQRISGVDNPALVQGAALFTADDKAPNQKFATLTTSPKVGGTVAQANLEQVAALPGVEQAFELPLGQRLGTGIAIIASDTFCALKAQQALQVDWQYGNASDDDWSTFIAAARQRLAQPTHSDAAVETDTADQMQIEASYEYAFVGHAQLEPLAAWVWVRDDAVAIRAASQQPNRAVAAVAKALNRPESDIEFRQQRAGGAFGRRLETDFIVQAALIAAKVDAPVLLQYSREDDFQRDYMRAGGAQRLTATVNSQGQIVRWRQRVVAPSHDGERAVSGAPLPKQHNNQEFPLPLVDDAQAVVELEPWQSPCGRLRAPGANVMSFPVQSFLHEVAVATKRDHQQLLLDLLGADRWLQAGDFNSLDTHRAKTVITQAAQLAGLQRRLPKGEGLGLAFHFSHYGYVALVAHVRLVDAMKFSVLAVTAAVDVGIIVNRNGAEAQVQGSIVDGLSVLAGQHIEYEQGVVQQTNLHQYPLLRMPGAPKMRVNFVPSTQRPTGLGEPALPPVAPAVANALFAAGGSRIRQLPFSAAGWQLV